MTVFLCLDNNNGMLFNNRRQSRDKFVIEDMASLLKENELYIDKFSEMLLKDKVKIKISHNLLEDFPKAQFVFVENFDISSKIEYVDKIVIYRWNRDYPSDFKFTTNLSELGFNLLETVDFPGSSHEKITKEVFGR